jgi:hypothetical protein
VPNAITDLSTTPASNSPSGSEAPTEGDNHLRTAYAFIRQLYDSASASSAAAAASLSAFASNLASAGTVTVGDALVAVKSPLTGGTARTQHAKNADFVSVKDFGATGDGTTDDLTALQAACDSGAKFIFFPEGTYMVTGPLLPKTQQTLLGAKRESTIIKAKSGFAGSALVSYPSGAYSGVTLEGLLLNGDSLAARCLEIIGVSQGAVDQVIVRDLRCALATTTQIYCENLTYWELDHVISSGGTGYALHIKTCYTGSSKNCVHYHGATSAVKVENSSDNTFLYLVCFNNAGTSSTSLLEIDGGHGNVFRDYTLEPQGASNVTQELLINDTVTGNCTGHEFISGQHIGLANTKTRSIVMGSSGTIYQTLFENMRVIKPTSNDSVLLTAQQETKFKNCRDQVAYDTPTFAKLTVTNNSGQPYNADNTQDLTLTINGSTGDPTSPTAVGGFVAPAIKNHTFFLLEHNFGAINWSAAGTGTFRITLPFSVTGHVIVGPCTLFATAVVGYVNGTTVTLYPINSNTALTWASAVAGGSLAISIVGYTSS